MSRADSLPPVFYEINACQLALLRWLVGQPGLEAPWLALLAVLKGRIAGAAPDSELHQLRLWGLADYRVGSKGGFFATYPAVASSLPRGRAVSLLGWLPILHSDTLRPICTAMGLKNPPTTKDGRIHLITSTLTDPQACQAVLERTSEEAQEFFAWLLGQGRPAGRNEVAAWLKAKGHAPVRGGIAGLDIAVSGYLNFYDAAPTPLEELLHVALVAPILPQPGAYYPSGCGVPEEVERAYTGRSFFDGVALQAPSLQAAEEVAGTAPNPTHVLRDVEHLLGFLASGRCEWKQDGQPYKRSLQAFGKAIQQPDPVYVDLLWQISAASELIQSRRRSTGFETAEVGAETPAARYSRLLNGWRNGPAWTYGTGSFVRSCLLNLLRNVPPDTSPRRRLRPP